MSLLPDPTHTFRLLDVEVATEGQDFVLLYSRRTRAVRRVSTAAALVLQQCQAFRTLDEHARVAARLPPQAGTGNHEANRRWLEDFAKDGFLVSPRDLRVLCDRTTDALNRPPPISTIAIPTYSRTDLLCRAILGCLANAQTHGREITFVVVNDHQQEAVHRDCRVRLQELKSQQGAKIQYAGLPEKEDFFMALKEEAGCDPALLRFGLFNDGGFPFAGGANRNLLLLHTVGEPFVCLDDDMECRVAEYPWRERRNEIAFSGSVPLERRFFADRERGWREVRFVEKDFLGLHEEFLGKDLGQCLTGATADFRQADGAFLARLNTGQGRVRATLTAHLGDPAITQREIATYLMLTGETFREMTKSETAYQRALTSREVWCGVSGRTIGAGSPGTAMSLGLDNRSLLPPFFPLGRGEDTIFGHLLWQCDPSAYFAHVPQAICHVPNRQRAFSMKESWRDPMGTYVSEIVSCCSRTLDWRPNSQTHEQRMRAMGRRLSEYGRLPQADFTHFIREQLVQSRAQHIRYLRGRLEEERGEPKYWAEDVRTYIQLHVDAMQRPDFEVPIRLCEHRSVEEARILIQQWLDQFGRLLQVWPDWVSAAGRLKAQGKMPARPV